MTGPGLSTPDLDPTDPVHVVIVEDSATDAELTVDGQRRSSRTLDGHGSAQETRHCRNKPGEVDATNGE